MDIENPCFCIKLRVGAIIVAVVDLVLGGLGALVAGYVISNTGIEVSSSQPGNATEPVANHGKPVDAGTASWVYFVLSLFLILCILQMVFSIFLILGVIKEKLLFLKGWLGFKASGALFSLGIFIGFIFLREQATIKPSVLDGVTFLYSLYCIWIVYALVTQIKKQQTGPVKPFRA